MADKDYKVQISPYVGNALVNVRGESVKEVVDALAELATAAPGVASSLGLIAANGNAVPLVTPAETTASTPEPPAPAAPDAVPNATPDATGPAGIAPTCSHGTKVYRDGTSKNGKWQAWMCPSPKNTPGQCSPEWIK